MQPVCYRFKHAKSSKFAIFECRGLESVKIITIENLQKAAPQSQPIFIQPLSPLESCKVKRQEAYLMVKLSICQKLY